MPRPVFHIRPLRGHAAPAVRADAGLGNVWVIDWLLVDIDQRRYLPPSGLARNSFDDRRRRDCTRDRNALCLFVVVIRARGGCAATPRCGRPYDAPVRVVVVRHAEAAAGEPDELRRLTPAGREQARALGERLPEPDAILTSPLLRARETGDLIGRASGVEAEVDERLAPGATAAGVREAVAGRGETVVVVAHQPDCGTIAAELGAGEVVFPPAGHCVAEL